MGAWCVAGKAKYERPDPSGLIESVLCRYARLWKFACLEKVSVR